MSQRCSGPMWPEALQSASWNWNWSTRLRKYLGREGEAGWGRGGGPGVLIVKIPPRLAEFTNAGRMDTEG